jgi:predicted ATPase
MSLVDMQFLEILEHTSTNIYFRSVHPFIREVLYQRMDYSQRRQLHLNVAETMQTTVSLEKNELQEQRILIYHWKLGENTRMQV